MASSESDSSFEQIPVNVRNQTQLWKKVEVSEDEFLNSWRKKSTYIRKKSTTTVYYCAYGTTCKVQLKKKELLNGVHECMVNSEPHSNHRSKRHGLSNKEKELVMECLKGGIDYPNNILLMFRSKGIPEPSKLMVSNFLQVQRRKLNQTGINCDIGDVIMWCNNNSAIPDDIDQPFVAGREFGDTINEKCDMRIFISTKRLLRQARFFDHIHTDATYKICHQGYPLLVVGVTDMARAFHPCAIALCKSEKSEDYRYLFQTLKDQVELESGQVYNPSYLVADCTSSITNGFASVFGRSFHRTVCYFHVKQAYQKYLRTIKDKEKKQEIFIDIEYLRLCSSPEIFKEATKLFIKKWEHDLIVSEFFKYFKSQWIENHSNWYYGCAKKGVPTTNNALEGTNRYIKEHYTKKRKLVIGQFLPVAMSMITSWSKMRNGEEINGISMEYLLIPTLPQLKAAKRWIQSKPDIVKKRGFAYFMSNGESVSTAVAVKKFACANRYLKWESFQDFILSEIDLHRIKYSNDSLVQDYSCSCKKYLLEYVCKHALGLGYLLKRLSFPDEVATGGLGKRRGPGRPRKPTSALTRD